MIETKMLPIGVAEELVQYLKPEYVMWLRAPVTKCIDKHIGERKDDLKVKLTMEDKLHLAVVHSFNAGPVSVSFSHMGKLGP